MVGVLLVVVLVVEVGNDVSRSWDWLSVVPCSWSPTENENG